MQNTFSEPALFFVVFHQLQENWTRIGGESVSPLVHILTGNYCFSFQWESPLFGN
jgi:hypothetical protein